MGGAHEDGELPYLHTPHDGMTVFACLITKYSVTHFASVPDTVKNYEVVKLCSQSVYLALASGRL